MRKVVAYIRVSTEEQARHGYSIEAQQRVLRDYADGHGLEIVEEFIESESAYKLGRQGFSAMLTFLKRHTEVDAVLCYMIDRISRNLQDYSALTEIMGVTIISATEQLPDNATGKLMGGVQAVFARYYSEQLSERVSLGLETKARKGYWPTYAPTGYRNEGQGIVPDPGSAPLIRELLERFAASDTSIDDATAWARERGLRSRNGGPLARSAIHKILTNPIYYGALPWKDRLYQGKHDPLVDRETFGWIQEKLHDRAPKKTERHFPYRGLLTCGLCGCRITAEIKKEKYVYYRCTYGRGKCEQPYHRQEAISDRLAVVIERVSLSDDIADKIITLAQTDDHDRRALRETRLKELRAEAERLASLLDDTYEDKLHGRIGEERWIRIDRRFTQQSQLIRDEQARLTNASEASLDDVRAALELLKRAPDLYQQQSHEERARLLQTVVSNCELTADNLVPIYRKPFDAVVEGKRSGEWLGEEDSNPH